MTVLVGQYLLAVSCMSVNAMLATFSIDHAPGGFLLDLHGASQICDVISFNFALIFHFGFLYKKKHGRSYQ